MLLTASFDFVYDLFFFFTFSKLISKSLKKHDHHLQKKKINKIYNLSLFLPKKLERSYLTLYKIKK